MKRSIPTGAWLAIGVVAAALVVPGVSSAATALTQIAGVNGTTVADVNKAHQLLTAPVAPGGMFTVTTPTTGIGGAGTLCVSLGTLPGGKAAILRDLRYWMFGGDQTQDSILMFTGSSCSGARLGILALGTGGGEETFDPGIAVPAGSTLSFDLDDQSGHAEGLSASVDGYSVPSAAVPASAPIVVDSRPSHP